MNEFTCGDMRGLRRFGAVWPFLQPSDRAQHAALLLAGLRLRQFHLLGRLALAMLRGHKRDQFGRSAACATGITNRVNESHRCLVG